MDPRRAPRAVADPKVRQVGFVTSTPPTLPSSLPSSSPPASDLSPVRIHPPRPSSAAVPVPTARKDKDPVGSYVDSPSSLGDDGDWSGIGRDSYVGSAGEMSGMSSLTRVSAVVMPIGVSEREKGKGVPSEVPNERVGGSKLKDKTSKAERRAKQEAERAAKALAKSTGNDSKNTKQPKVAKPSQKKDGPQAPITSAASEKKDAERLPEKDRKKDGTQVPQPRMQFDDKHRVEKAKKRAVVNQSEARKIVELFRHLPQYAHGTQLPDLESRFFQLDHIHPSVYKVGLQYLAGDVTGGNARCIAMLLAFRDAIGDYTMPQEKNLNRDLTAKIGSYVSFLIECRPLSISMGNAIRFLKIRIGRLPMSISEGEAKSSLQSDIDRFINEKIVIAGKAIVEHAVTKICDGDVLLTHGSSCVVEMILLSAHEKGINFRVVIIDSRPKLEGQLLLRRLVAKGISCTYTHINAVSYTMHEVTRVFLGASSVLSNGTVYSRVGTASVAMVAHAFRVPVLICCEAYKFHNRVQLDSICSNELGDPDIIAKVPGRKEVNYLENWADSDNLQLLNLTYDTTPSDYVTMIITDYGMVPPTSVPVIVREYCREQLWI